MKTRFVAIGIVVAAVALGGLEASSNVGGPTVRDYPPVVVKTVPVAGDAEVDAAKVKEIRVTFSKDMVDQSWSWSTFGEDTQIPMVGRPRYDKDKRTCIAKVDLEPGHTYATWLNSERYTNFRDTDGMSAVPYLLVFQTKPEK